MNVFNKILKVTAVISCSLIIVQLVVIAFIKIKYAVDLTETTDIGIIGGSDGPTVLFTASKTTGFIGILLKCCPYIAIISIMLLLAKRIYTKHKN